MTDNTQETDTTHGTKPKLMVVGGIDKQEPQGTIKGRTGKHTEAGLTAKQEAFCQQLANGLDNTAAYRLAFNAENMKAATIWSESCKLAARPSVKARVTEILGQKQRKQGILSEKQADRIWRNVWELAEGSSTPPAVRASALQLAAKMAGMLTDQVKVETTSDSKSIESELLERLRKLSA